MCCLFVFYFIFSRYFVIKVKEKIEIDKIYQVYWAFSWEQSLQLWFFLFSFLFFTYVSIVWSYIRKKTIYSFTLFFFAFFFCIFWIEQWNIWNIHIFLYRKIKNFTWCAMICTPFLVILFSLIWTSNRSFFASKFTYFQNKTKFTHGKWNMKNGRKRSRKKKVEKWTAKLKKRKKKHWNIYESVWRCQFAMQHLLHI